MKPAGNPAQMQGNQHVGELGKFTNLGAHGIGSSFCGLERHIKYPQRTDLIFVLVP